jgi:Ca2+/Na+ antiporter
MTIPVKDAAFHVRRLNRLNVFAGIAMIIASVFMFKHRMEWVACLLISALLQLYTSFIMPKEKK